MAIIDFHSHILPGIDDGARNIEISQQMISVSEESGVAVMVATPHFYADENRIETFIKRRNEAYEKIKPFLTNSSIKILLGAEVAFFEGISRAEDVNKLLIEGTNCMLLEMPFRRWRPEDIEEVENLIKKRSFKIMIAHLERYMNISGNDSYIKELLKLPVIVQINADSLLDWHGRGRIVKMFKKGSAHLLGSDAHGIKRRPPRLMEGRDLIEKKVGPACLDKIDSLGAELLGL